MKRVAVLLSAALLAGGISTAAIADESSGQGASGSKSQPSASMSAKDFKGEHTMTGTISKIDHNEGTLTLKTAKEDLELHFPPAAIKDYKEGDQVTVQLGIAKAGAQTGSHASAAPAKAGK
ncbi:MAG TPA: hypothetical protein VGX03_06700 [Candidatus Binatia bacterium]|nr:hypothetical protein [Candidatus Binatia bacterium]